MNITNNICLDKDLKYSRKDISCAVLVVAIDIDDVKIDINSENYASVPFKVYRSSKGTICYLLALQIITTRK